MNRRFISIRSKFLLLLGYFLAGLITVVSLSFYFENVQQQMELQYWGLLQQGTRADHIQHLATSLHRKLYRIVYQGKTELQSRILAENEDLLTEFDDFTTSSQEYGFDEDYFFLLENETILLKLRADIFRAVVMVRDGDLEQAAQLMVQHIEPSFFHMQSFVENANELRRLKIADHYKMKNAQHIQQHALETTVISAALFLGFVIVIFVSRSIVEPIESLTRQIRALEHGSAGQTRLVNTANDESAILTDAFNSLLEVRERDEAAIRERERQVGDLLDSTAEAIYGLDMHGNCTFANPACVRILGYRDADELFGRNMHELIHHTRLDGAPYPEQECPIFKAFRSSNGTHVDSEVLWRADGSNFPAEYWSYPIRRDDKTIGAVVTFLDITERKQTEQALKISEANLAEAQQIAKLGSWELDVTTGKAFWSDQEYRCLGYRPRDCEARYDNFEASVHPGDRDRVNQATQAALGGELDPYDIEHRVIWQDGSEHIMHERGVVERDEDGNPVRMIGTTQDITERKRAEEAIRTLNQELEDRVRKRTSELQVANKELESFAYSVSHDLRAPLRAIDGFSLALVEDYGKQLDETAHDYLQRVRNGAQRMGTLIDDMLQLSRVNRSELVMEEVDLTKIAEAVLEELRTAESGRQVKLILDPNMRVQGDPRLLGVMLDNLLSNAWKFTSCEAVSHITFKAKLDQPEIFYISDNGVGFDMRHANKLFGAFQRLHRVTDFPGTGVGLATAQRIIHRHGGRIWAEAQEGEGATFYFSLGTARVSQVKPATQRGETLDAAEDLTAGRG